MNTDTLRAEREHLANLLEALQRCSYFLNSAASAIDWPIDGPSLKRRQKDQPLFQALAACNERFSKMQDTIAAAMRHSALLMGEATTPFLRVLAFFEKLHVIESVESWQLCRAARNLAAHDYETSYDLIAEHFNELHALQRVLVEAAERLIQLCAQSLDVHPATDDFQVEFMQVCRQFASRRPTAG